MWKMKWILVFPEGINEKGNVTKLIQEFNLAYHVNTKENIHSLKSDEMIRLMVPVRIYMNMDFIIKKLYVY